jgi:hypothetical protein
MTTRSRLLGATVALAGAGAIALASTTAPAQTGSAAAKTKKITRRGVDGVKLGKRHGRLRAKRRVGKLRPGCELAGPGTHSARLRAPLKGTVDYRKSSPPRVRSVTITGGATARGVGVGDTLADVKDAFRKAKVIKDTEEVFQIWLVRIPKRGGGRMAFAVDPDTREVRLIGVPVIPFCE